MLSIVKTAFILGSSLASSARQSTAKNPQDSSRQISTGPTRKTKIDPQAVAKVDSSHRFQLLKSEVTAQIEVELSRINPDPDSESTGFLSSLLTETNIGNTDYTCHDEDCFGKNFGISFRMVRSRACTLLEHVFCKEYDPKVIDFLIQEGVDPTLSQNGNPSPLQQVENYFFNDDYELGFELAALRGTYSQIPTSVLALWKGVFRPIETTFFLKTFPMPMTAS
jgi:hypothetical protein